MATKLIERCNIELRDFPSATFSSIVTKNSATSAPNTDWTNPKSESYAWADNT